MLEKFDVHIQQNNKTTKQKRKTSHRYFTQILAKLDHRPKVNSKLKNV